MHTSLEEWTPGTLSAEELVLGIAKLRWLSTFGGDGSTVSFQWMFTGYLVPYVIMEWWLMIFDVDDDDDDDDDDDGEIPSCLSFYGSLLYLPVKLHY